MDDGTVTFKSTINLLSSLKKDNYEAELAFRTLTDLKTVPFTVEGYEPSHALFPTLIERYLTGSRAEFLYTDNSDYDYLYEIGPGLVRDFRNKRDDDTLGDFYWKPTENPGFYTIEDGNGRFLYSHIVQHKLAPLFLTGQEPHIKHRYDFEDTSKTRAAISYSNKDFVVGLRLAEWPKELLESFPMKNVIEELKDIPLFLIAKNYPGSSLAKLQWRISFSLVELEILNNLPYYQRKAFLHLKHSLKDVEEIPSYLLKTAFLTVSANFKQDLPQKESDATKIFYKELNDYLKTAMNEKYMRNFFVPSQNLFSLVDRTQLDPMKEKYLAFVNCNNTGNPPDQVSDLVEKDNLFMSDDEALLNCLAVTYQRIIRVIYRMVSWKSSVKQMCEMMPHKFTDQIREHFQSLARINSYFDEKRINEYEFSAYITELTLLDLEDWKNKDACLILCGRGYFSTTGHVTQVISEINKKYEPVVDWIERIISRIKQEKEQNRHSFVLRKESVKSVDQILKTPAEALRDRHLSREKQKSRKRLLKIFSTAFGIITLFLLFIVTLYFSLA